MDPSLLLERRILIVDDEPSNVSVLVRLLERHGYREVRGITDPREFDAVFGEFEPDLLLLDLHMPHRDGFSLMEGVRAVVPESEYLPVLVLTGDLAPEVRERALSVGARDFITKPFDLTEVLLRIKNLMEARVLHLELRDYNRTLEERVRERTRELAEAQLEILDRLARAAEYRDDLTGRHAQRVGLLAAELMREVGCDEDEAQLVRWAATLHDVGKIGIPDAILMKPGPLTPAEYELMKSHTAIGDQILSGSRFRLLQMAGEIASSHHERWDGGGYRGLAGEEIPLVGRVVAVADAYDSLTHQRPYKDPVGSDEAADRIVRDRGTHFDPGVVDAFQRLRARGILAGLDARVLEEEVAEDRTAGTAIGLLVSSPERSGPGPSS